MEIFKKMVDRSLLKEGMSIPIKEQELFLKCLKLNLGFGETINIKVLLNDVPYDAELKNQKYDKTVYPDHVPVLQIRYSPKSDLAKELRKNFAASRYYLELHKDEGEGKKKIRIPEDRKEYVKLVACDEPKTIEFQCEKINDVEAQELAEIMEENVLRDIAIEHSNIKEPRKYTVECEVMHRDQYISEYAKRLANGICQLCGENAPFNNKDGKPYLESHHINWLSNGGEDSIDNVVALCPNCHRKMHILNMQGDVDTLKNTVNRNKLLREDNFDNSVVGNISLESLIDDLPLSNRSKNSLNKEGVKNVNELLMYTEEDLYSIAGLGKKSIDEILEFIDTHRALQVDSNTETNINVKTFIGEDNVEYIDIPLKNMNMSYRAYNQMGRAGYHYYSEAKELSVEEISNIRGIGVKSAEEIVNVISNIKLEPYNINLEEIERQKGYRYNAEMILGNKAENSVNLFNAIIREISDRNLSDLKAAKKWFSSNFMDVEILKEKFEEELYSIIQNKPFGIGFESITECLEFDVIYENITLGLDDLIDKKRIFENKEGMYEARYMTPMEYANTIQDEKKKYIFTERIKGKTLDEIGKSYNVTRERIRQLEKKIIDKKPRLSPDKYVDFFSKYNVDRKDFIIIFGDDEIYNYLSMVADKGKQDLENIFEDEEMPEAIKKIAEKIVYKNYITIYGERVPCKRDSIMYLMLRTQVNGSIRTDQAIEMYNNMVKKLNVGELDLTVNSGTYSNKLEDSRQILCSIKRNIRYYNIDANDYTILFDELNLEMYSDIEISALKLFREHEDLMQEYDIRDEYELHNLLKKLYSKNDLNIMFSRSPNIKFGNANRSLQVKDLLIEHAPIPRNDLAEKYEEEYGVLKDTVIANYFSEIDDYLYDGIYKIDAPMLPDIYASKLKENLKEEFYLLSDIRKMYKTLFPNADPGLLNPYSIKKLGFMVYSDYAINSKYNSATEYFRTLLLKNEFTNAEQFPVGVRSTIQYDSELRNRKAEYDIIEYEPLRYINIERLNRLVSVSKETLKTYCQDICNMVSDKYFTIHSLWESGCEHELDMLGYDEWFYASVLCENKELFDYKRIGKNKVFTKRGNEIDLRNFIEWIIYKDVDEYIYLEDLCNELKKQYNVLLNPYNIIECLENSDLYYDRISRKIFIDYDAFLDMIDDGGRYEE